MAVFPWMTSDTLVESISRKISLPLSQGTFSKEDILAFATEEMFISQVPSVMIYHEEYFVWPVKVPLVPNKTRYPIPDRAIGMKIRDLFYEDQSGNLFEMTRISEDDKAFFQRQMGTYQTISKYYFESNNIVLSPFEINSPTGYLNFAIYLRPNVLVPNERAAIIQCFTKTITVDNSQVVAGDTVTINGSIFEAVASSPTANQFLIAGDSLGTAANLASVITISGIIRSAGVGSPATTTATLCYNDIVDTSIVVSNNDGFSLQVSQGIQFNSIPDHIVDGVVIDILETKAGHSMRDYGITLGTNSVSGNIITFPAGVVPSNVIVGDYICVENECIIPQIPTDLHSGLAERTCARILAAIGDQAGQAASDKKIAEIDQSQGTLLNNRAEGSIKKVVSRHSLLAMGKMAYRRRF